MSKKTIIVAVLSLSLVAVGAGLVQAHSARAGGGYGGYGPAYECDGPRGGYGPGMMGYGQGMMGYGGMRGHMGWDGDDARGDYRGERANADISQDEAKAMIELSVSRNPYLKVGKVTANDDGFEIQVVTKKGGDLVNRLQVKKNTGRIFPIFE